VHRARVVAAILAVLPWTAVPRAIAHTDACAFQGVMTTPPGPWTPFASVPYILQAQVGACVNDVNAFTATGDIVPFLLLTTGTGTTTTGHRFAFTGAGGVVEVVGEAVGVLSIVPFQDSQLFGPGNNIVVGTLALVNGPPS
jgi:hypothetical protein